MNFSKEITLNKMIKVHHFTFINFKFQFRSVLRHLAENDFLRQEKRHLQTLAVRETGVSRHQGGPIEGPPETPRTSQHYHIEGLNIFSLYYNSFLK